MFTNNTYEDLFHGHNNRSLNMEDEHDDDLQKPGISTLTVSESVSVIRSARSRRDIARDNCQACCRSICNIVANDSIYGSFFGPHPVSCCCCCARCNRKRKCRKKGKKCRPLLTASLVTKLMSFVMLFIIICISWFFVSPWFVWIGDEKKFLDIGFDRFFPCSGKKNFDGPGGCEMHAGYYMAYRCFLSFAIVMLTSALVMIDVTSTTDDPYRKKCHHGFWMYKYFYLLCILVFFFFVFNGKTDPYCWFEYVIAIAGTGVAALFTFVELVIVMELVEILAVAMTTRKDHGGNFLYKIITTVVFAADITAYALIAIWFSFKLDFKVVRLKEEVRLSMTYKQPVDHPFIRDMMSKFEPTWPVTNCLEGERIGPSFFESELELLHVGLIAGMGGFFLILIIGMAFKKRCFNRYPLQGWLQCSMLILFNLFYLWSALQNSDKVNSRPRCNWALALVYGSWNPLRHPEHRTSQFGLRPGSYDTFFQFTGLIHGIIAIVTLVYCAFLHGPRTKSAPLTLAFRLYVTKGYDRIPVLPSSKNSPNEFKIAVKRLEVWDDERETIGQSWSFFYALMSIGSISLMMAMTNYTDVAAKELYNSSQIAMFVKYSSSILWTLVYCTVLICPCSGVYRGYVDPTNRGKELVIVRSREAVNSTSRIFLDIPDEEDRNIERRSSNIAEHLEKSTHDSSTIL